MTKQLKKPNLIAPILSSVAGLLLLIGLALTASGTHMKSSEKLLPISLQALGMFLSLSQWIVYFRAYIDYRLGHTENEKPVLSEDNARG